MPMFHKTYNPTAMRTRGEGSKTGMAGKQINSNITELVTALGKGTAGC